MTLNITVIAKTGIYQSSDFQLSVSGVPIKPKTTKSVMLQYADFAGMLTYTGVAKWPGKYTSERAVIWLQEIGDASYGDVVGHIATRASRWLREARMAHNDDSQSHSFILAAILASGRRVMTLISNYEDCYGRRFDEIEGELIVSSRQSSSRPIILFTGNTCSVERQDRKYLMSTVRAYQDYPERIRSAMKFLNEKIAGTDDLKRTISVDSTVLHMRTDGVGVQEVTPGGVVDLHAVIDGSPIPKVSDLIKSMGLKGGRFVGAAFVQSGMAVSKSLVVKCEPRILEVPGTHKAEFIAIPGQERSRGRGINSVGSIVGDGIPVGRIDKTGLWYRSENGDTTLLSEIKGGGSAGIALNNANEVVGTLANDSGALTCYRWGDGTFSSLGGYGECDAGVRAINDDGIAVGWASISQTDRSQLSHRPAIWIPGRLPIVIMLDPMADWGEAVAVSSKGHVLLSVYQKYVNYPAIYYLEDGRIEWIGKEFGSIIPIGINGFGDILGAVNTPEGRLAVLGEGGSRWKAIGVKADWHPCAMSDTGWITGSMSDRSFISTWLRTPGGEVRMLPRVAYHNCRPFAVNDLGDVVGVASADHCGHAVVWKNLNSSDTPSI